MKVAVSILSSKYPSRETIQLLNATDADYLHVDIADGHFVSNTVLDYEGLEESKHPLDVHLMVSRPFEFISKFASLNTEEITIHAELEEDLDSLIDYIHERGMKAGLALNPETDISKIDHFLDKIDIVLVMSVHPGLGGQKFLESTVPKIVDLKKLREEKSYKYEIYVDGGINDETVKYVQDADTVISGSFICKSEDYQVAIDALKTLKK